MQDGRSPITGKYRFIFMYYDGNILWFYIGVISVLMLKVNVSRCVQMSLEMGFSSELQYDGNFHFLFLIVNNGECEAPAERLSALL